MITGTIYKIECFKTNQIYYGSTTKSLFEKMREYFESYMEYQKGTHPFKAPFALFNGNDYKFFLISSADYEHMYELKNKTHKYIEENECINKLFIDKVKKRIGKEYRETNKDKIKEYKRAYREANKESINEKRREQRAQAKQLKENK